MTTLTALPTDVPPVLTFTSPLPGLLDLRDFTLDALDETDSLFTMRAAQSEAIRLFLIAAQAYFPDYAPLIDDATRRSLGLLDGINPLILAIVNPGDDDDLDPTANLLAPVIVNPVSGRAAQVILDGTGYGLRTPLSVGH